MLSKLEKSRHKTWQLIEGKESIMQQCPTCGTEYSGNFCPECGDPAPSSANIPVLPPAPPPQNARLSQKGSPEPFPKWIIPVLILGALLFMSLINAFFIQGNDKLPQDSPKNSPSVSTASPSTGFGGNEPFSIRLSAGFYAGGIDLPAGMYTITALSGSGNVISDAGLNQLMGDGESDFYIQSFQNAPIRKKTVLQITGNLVVQLSSDAAEVDALTPRTNELTETVTLTSGNYTAGADFPAGVYDIQYVDGHGNVMTNTGVNELFGNQEGFRYIQYYHNAVFDEGSTLQLSQVTVALVPSRAK